MHCEKRWNFVACKVHCLHNNAPSHSGGTHLIHGRGGSCACSRRSRSGRRRLENCAALHDCYRATEGGPTWYMDGWQVCVQSPQS